MATIKFDSTAGVIVLDVRLTASLTTIAQLALDTGATNVVLPRKFATAIGLKVDPNNTIQTTTATRVETVPKVIIPEVSVLGKRVKNVKAIIKDLPPQSPIDGLLGLSFLKNFKLTIDFKKEELTIE